MKTLFYYLKIYLRLASQDIKARLGFRQDFFYSLLGHILTNGLGILSIMVIFNRIPSLAGWEYNELLFLYGFFLLACLPFQLFYDKLWMLTYAVQTGQFIIYYFKPLNMLFYYVSQAVDLKAFGQLGIGLYLMIHAGRQLGIDWTLLKWGAFLLMYLGAAFTYLGIRVAIASSAFWLMSNTPLMSFLNQLNSFARYPMTIYSAPFRFIFTYIIPFSFMAFTPVSTLLRSPEVSISWLLTPLVGIVVYALGYAVWVRGIKAYTGTGS